MRDWILGAPESSYILLRYPGLAHTRLSHHMMFLLHDNQLFLAPVEDPHEVLDVGTGTGIWAM